MKLNYKIFLVLFFVLQKTNIMASATDYQDLLKSSNDYTLPSSDEYLSIPEQYAMEIYENRTAPSYISTDYVSSFPLDPKYKTQPQDKAASAIQKAFRAKLKKKKILEDSIIPQESEKNVSKQNNSSKQVFKEHRIKNNAAIKELVQIPMESPESVDNFVNIIQTLNRSQIKIYVKKIANKLIETRPLSVQEQGELDEKIKFATENIVKDPQNKNQVKRFFNGLIEAVLQIEQNAAARIAAQRKDVAINKIKFSYSNRIANGESLDTIKKEVETKLNSTSSLTDLTEKQALKKVLADINATERDILIKDSFTLMNDLTAAAGSGVVAAGRATATATKKAVKTVLNKGIQLAANTATNSLNTDPVGDVQPQNQSEPLIDDETLAALGRTVNASVGKAAKIIKAAADNFNNPVIPADIPIPADPRPNHFQLTNPVANQVDDAVAAVQNAAKTAASNAVANNVPSYVTWQNAGLAAIGAAVGVSALTYYALSGNDQKPTEPEKKSQT